MKRRHVPILLVLLVLMVAILFWRHEVRDAAMQAAAQPVAQPPEQIEEQGGMNRERAAGADAAAWTPPAVFSRQGAPSPTIPFPRGIHSERQHQVPKTRAVDAGLAERAPSVMAMSPQDGRFGLLPEEIDLHTLQARRMVFDPTALNDVIEGRTSRLLAPTTDQEVLTIDVASIKTRSFQSHTLIGTVHGEETTSNVMLVYHDGVIYGSVARYSTGRHFEYRILTDGHMMVRELDQSTMHVDCGNGPDTVVEEASEQLAPDGTKTQPAPEVAYDTVGWRTIDVVVGYDPAARVAEGGYSQMEAKIIASVDQMTTAFANSQIANTEIMLLGTIEDSSYVYPGAVSGDMGSADELGDLENLTDGNLDVVSNYYTQLGADMVSFVLKQADGSAGIAYRPGRSSVVARDYMTSNRITFAHELGHNLGCDHSWGDSSQSYHSLYGWRFDPAATVAVRTIMAYDWNWGNGDRVPYYSNPNVSYNGAATGAVNGYNVQGDATADQRYYQGGMGYTGSDPTKYGFNGTNAALGANNANTIDTGAGNSSYGATYCSNRKTRTAFAVTSPASGAQWTSGSTQTIFFVGGDHTDTADIKLYKGGVLQSTLATGINPANGRSFPWSLPGSLVSGSDYMIRVTLNHAAGGSNSADSGNFSVVGLAPNTVQVNSPNGGEAYYVGSTQTITWVSNVSGAMKIELYKAGVLNSVLSASETNDGTYSWVISSGLTPAADYKIKISSATNSAYNDSSDANFTLSAQPTLADALDTTGITWSTSGNANWVPQTITSHDGVDAAKSGTITDSQTSTIQATFTGAGTLTFWWKVSSESGFDYLKLLIDDVEQTGSLAKISGDSIWEQKTVSIASGSHTVKWTYAKDSSVAAGADAAWVDQVVYTPTAGTYSVTYDGNGSSGGSVPVDSTAYSSGATATVLGNTGSLVKTGYTFAGWNTAANGSGTNYTAGNTFTIAANTTLYAKWTANSYTVTFNANGGGTPSPTSKSVTYDAAYGTLATVSRTGYTFAGWYTAASGGTLVGTTTTVTTASNHTLYAQWTGNSYTVTFNANGGGTPSPTTKSVTYGSAYGTLATVTRAGYTLNGWYTAASGGSLVTDVTTVATTANHTLYAQWSVTTYTVTYDGNGSTGGAVPVDGNSYLLNGTVTVSGNSGSLVRTSYIFGGWNTAADGSGTSYAAGASFSISSNVTLYAKWNAGPVVIHEPFNYNAGALNAVTANAGGVTGAWAASGTVEAGSLSFGTLPAGTGGKVLLNNQYGGIGLSNALASAGLLADGANLWFSVVVQTGGDIGANGDLGFALGTDRISSGNNIPVQNSGNAIGFTFKSGQLKASAWEPTLTRATGPGAAVSTTYLIVGRITWGAGSETIDIYNVGADLSKGSIVSTYTTSINFDQSTFDTITFGSKASTPSHALDEIRFGATYESVTGQGLSSYNAWAAGTFAKSFTDIDPTHNPDGDNLTNLQEFAFGLDPSDPKVIPMSYVEGGALTAPGAPITVKNGSTRLAVFTRRKDYVIAGLTYSVQFSPDLTTWTTSSDIPTLRTSAADPGNYEAVSVPYPSTNPPPKFFRVGVTGN